MSEDFIFALVLSGIGVAMIVVGSIYALRQKTYYDPTNNSVVNEIDVPWFGKVKTNTPAIALCFFGLIMGFFAYETMAERNPKLVNFEGEIAIDQGVDGIDAVLVGVTSGSFLHTETPEANHGFPVEIKVPISWPSYSAYAFAIGASKTRPTIIGTNLEHPKFKLSIRPLNCGPGS